MIVALATREFPPEVYGGAGVHVAELASALAELVQVEVHCFGAPRASDLVVRTYQPWKALGTDTPEGAAFGVLSVDLAIAAALGGPSGSSWGTPAGAASQTSSGSSVGTSSHTSSGTSPALVHSHTWYANLAGHLAKLTWNIPHVVTTHSLEPLRPWKVEQLGGGYALSGWCERTALEAADAVIAVSEAMRTDLLACYPAVRPERVEVIHNGIDTERWRPERGTDVLRRYGLDGLGGPKGLDGPQASAPMVLFVGRVTRQKGLSYLLAAAPLLRGQAQLVCCAGAADTPELAAEVADLVREARAAGVRLTWIEGQLAQREVAQLMTHACVFVCPSVYEPFGLVNLEAMACGTAVVASSVGGIPEVVADGETGLLVPIEMCAGPDGKHQATPADPERFASELAERIGSLVADPDLASRMGEAGRRRAVEQFSWSAVARQTVGLYRRIAAP